MKKHPGFGEDAVRALATVDSFERGRDYLRRGAVYGIERRGNRQTAEVEGREYAAYAVTIVFARLLKEKKEIDAALEIAEWG